MQLESAAGLVEPAQPGRRTGRAGARQGERDQRVAGRGAGLAMAAGADYDILAPLPEIAGMVLIVVVRCARNGPALRQCCRKPGPRSQC